MSIYLGHDSQAPKSLSELSPRSPAHECIGFVYNALSQLLRRGSQPEHSLMDRISADIESPELLELVRKVSQEANYHLSPTEDGVLFAVDNSTKEPFAVIKPSRKRANYETFAYLLSKKLGLNNYILPSAFCAIKNPRALSSESIENGDWMEELFNGDFKQLSIPALDSPADDEREEFDPFDSDDSDVVFSFEDPSNKSEDDSGSEAKAKSAPSSPTPGTKDYFAIGVIEPFINKTIGSINDENLGEYAKMVLLCLALGLRDGKDDGYINFKLIDIEEIMPTYLVPPEAEADKKIAATHLPLLDNPFSEKKLPEALIRSLREITESWDFDDLNDFLTQYPLKYPDFPSETLKRRKMTEGLLDEGGCEFTYIPERQMMRDQPGAYQFKGLPKKESLERMTLLEPSQIDTFFRRILRIQEFVRKKEEFSIRDLVFHVDPQYKVSMDQISEIIESGIAIGNLNAHSYRRASPFDTAGRMSPFHVREKTSPKK